MLRCAAKCTSLLAQYTPGQWVDVGEISMRTRYFIFKFIHLSWRFCRSWFFGLCYGQTQLALHCIDWFVRGLKTAKGATNFMRKVWIFVSMESASADDVRARGSPKGLVLAPLQAQAQHYPKGEGWKRSQFGSRKRSQTDRQTDAPTTTTLIASGPPLRGDPYFVCISTTLLRNKICQVPSSFGLHVDQIRVQLHVAPCSIHAWAVSWCRRNFDANALFYFQIYSSFLALLSFLVFRSVLRTDSAGTTLHRLTSEVWKQLREPKLHAKSLNFRINGKCLRGRRSRSRIAKRTRACTPPGPSATLSKRRRLETLPVWLTKKVTDRPTDRRTDDHINRVWTSTPWRPILRMYLHYVT